MKRCAVLMLCFLKCYAGFVDQIPDNREKTAVSCLMDFFARYSTLPYCLLGSKPMAIEYFNKTEIIPSAPYRLHIWWSSWEKNREKFEGDNFVFRVEDNECVYLFNKARVLDAITDNFDLFAHLGETPDRICEVLYRVNNTPEFLRHDNRLYGILLGFGRGNSIAFHDLYDSHILPKMPLIPFNKEEFTGFDFYRLPEFMVMDTEETAVLKRNYKLDQKKIASIFNQRNAVDVFLEYLQKKQSDSLQVGEDKDNPLFEEGEFALLP